MAETGIEDLIQDPEKGCGSFLMTAGIVAGAIIILCLVIGYCAGGGAPADNSNVQIENKARP